MKTKTKQIYTILIGFSMMFVFWAGTAIADSSNVTVRWVVPGDYSISVELPANADRVQFSVDGKNFSDYPALGQLADTPAIRITNTGNTNIEIEARFSSAFHTNVTHVNFTTDNTSTTERIPYGTGNYSTNQTWVDPLSMGANHERWAWTSGNMVPESAGADATLVIYSKAT